MKRYSQKKRFQGRFLSGNPTSSCRPRRSSNFRANSSPSSDFVRFKQYAGGLLSAEFNEEDSEEDRIVKKALVIVEGNHTDNSGKSHKFSQDDIEWFAESTNDFLSSGGRVPWQADHDKKQGSNLGDLENFLVPEIITEENLPDPKLKKQLVGKLGLFATELVGKGKDVVEKIRAGSIKTLSPGIDMKTGIIREISATPTPAIVGMSIFSRAGIGTNALSWKEAESAQNINEDLKEDYEKLTDTLWNLSTNVISATEEEIPMDARQAKLDEIMSGFGDRLVKLLGIDAEENSLTGASGIKKNPVGREVAQATHRTQQLTLSAKIDDLSKFKRRDKVVGIGGRIGRASGTVFGGKSKGIYVAGAGVGLDTRKRRRRKKRRRS